MDHGAERDWVALTVLCIKVSKETQAAYTKVAKFECELKNVVVT